MLTSRSLYGLRLLIDLADRGDSGLTDMAGIAGRQAIPEAYLAKLLAPLKTAGIVATFRGPTGGLALARPAQRISLLEIVEALEGRASLGLDRKTDDSAEAEPRASETWKRLDVALRKELAGISLADAARSAGIEYHI